MSGICPARQPWMMAHVIPHGSTACSECKRDFVSPVLQVRPLLPYRPPMLYRLVAVLWLLVAMVTALLLSGCSTFRNVPTSPSRGTSELILTAHPSVMIRPGWVTLTARLSEGADVVRFECSAIHWTYGDGEASLHQVFTNCEGIPRAWSVRHFYKGYGEYKPGFYLRSQVDGRILAWADATILIQSVED